MKGSKLSFDSIADRYDLMNHLASAGQDIHWRRVLARHLAASTGSGQQPSVLDLATGTGDLALKLAADFPDAKIYGMDISGPMLREAQKKAAARSNAANAVFAQGDAHNIPHPPHIFDAVCIAFGMRNCTEPATVLAEINRVLKPGGHFYVLEFFRPQNRLLQLFEKCYVGGVMPMLAKVFARNHAREYRYLYNSVAGYVSAGQFVESAEKAGFRCSLQQNFVGGLCTLLVFRKA